MFSRISNLSMALGGGVGVRRRRRATIVCITLIVIVVVQQVAAAEMEAGTWTQKADMPTARYIAGSAVADGKIYVIGGAPVRFGETAAVEEYDPATDTWTRRADMPTARQGVRAAAVDGIIYAIGGCEILGDRDSPTVEAYDPAADTWTTKTDMPTARTLSAIAVVDGQIYVIGGVFGDEDVESHALSAVEAYDPATGEWTRKADMPTARYYPAACVVDGRIYVSGGSASWDSPKPLPTVEVYNLATDAWSQTSDMPKGKSHHTASVVAGKMYIIGGMDQGGAGVVDVYDPATDTWTTATRPAAYKSSVVDVYDPATDMWTTAAERLPTPRWDLTANVVDGKIYTIGGRPGDAEPLSIVEEYDPGLPGVISSVSPAGKLWETWGEVKSE